MQVREREGDRAVRELKIPRAVGSPFFSPSYSVMKHLLLWAALSALSTASPTRSTTQSRLALVPRSSTSVSSLSTSSCAQYLSTIGVATLSDVYYLDGACASPAGLSKEANDDLRIVQLPQSFTIPTSEHKGSVHSYGYAYRDLTMPIHRATSPKSPSIRLSQIRPLLRNNSLSPPLNRPFLPRLFYFPFRATETLQKVPSTSSIPIMPLSNSSS